MGRDLLEINVFSESINRCTEALNGYEINVRNMLLRSDDDTYNDQINAYVGLTAIQVISMQPFHPITFMNCSFKSIRGVKLFCE